MKPSQANGDARKISSVSQGCWTQNCWWGGERKAINQKPGSKGPGKRADGERIQKTGFCQRSSLRFFCKGAVLGAGCLQGRNALCCTMTFIPHDGSGLHRNVGGLSHGPTLTAWFDFQCRHTPAARSWLSSLTTRRWRNGEARV